MSLHFLEKRGPNGKWIEDNDNPYRRMVMEGRVGYFDLLVRLHGAEARWELVGPFEKSLANLQADATKTKRVEGRPAGDVGVGARSHGHVWQPLAGRHRVAGGQRPVPERQLPRNCGRAQCHLEAAGASLQRGTTEQIEGAWGAALPPPWVNWVNASQRQ